MNPLYRRIADEKRSIVLPLAIGIAANILAYAFVVYPLGIRSAGAADRAAQATATRLAAEREHAAAVDLVGGKARAEEELDAFYKNVLPADLVAVRRMTYGPLIDMAESSNVTYLRRVYSEEVERATEGQLTRITIRMVFQGTYENLRNFIYELETAPEFVIVDEVALAESDEDRQTLTLTLTTYFRTRGDGV
jgi:hypothetical protein